MKILETEQGWTVEHNGVVPVKIEGTDYFQDKTVLETAIRSRKLYVWSDGSIEKRPEPGSIAALAEEAEFENAAPKDSSGAPPTQDPPTDPNAQPDDPDPNPTSPEPIVAPKEKKAAAKKPRAKKVPPVEESPDKPRRGRPRKYTPEEAVERRREQARSYASNRTEEQKAAARERARRWRENNPDKVKEARAKSMESRTERYKGDPEYRQQFNQYQRDYKRSKREGAE